MKITETERLLVEEATIADAGFFFKLLNSPNWVEFIGDRSIRSLKDAEDYIKNSLITSYERKGFGLWKVSLREIHKPIGICGFLKRDYLDHPDIGFAILPEYEGQGYTHEASKAVVKYGKEKLGLDTVLAITTEKNKRSQKLLDRLSFSVIGKVKLEGEELLLYSHGKLNK